MLVKHAQPVLDPARAAREWRLGPDGEEQARRLAAALARFLPFRLFSSPEPKAARTAEIISAHLRVHASTIEDLRELDRPVLPILASEEHAALNARVFARPDERTLGAESAQEARARFATAVRTHVSAHSHATHVFVTHGTVISLFVASIDTAIDAFELWKRLRCASFVVLDGASFAVLEVIAA